MLCDVMYSLAMFPITNPVLKYFSKLCVLCLYAYRNQYINSTVEFKLAQRINGSLLVSKIRKTEHLYTRVNINSYVNVLYTAGSELATYLAKHFTISNYTNH